MVEQVAEKMGADLVISSEYELSPSQDTEVKPLLKVNDQTWDEEQKQGLEYKDSSIASFKHGEFFEDAQIPTKVSNPSFFGHMQHGTRHWHSHSGKLFEDAHTPTEVSNPPRYKKQGARNKVYDPGRSDTMQK